MAESKVMDGVHLPRLYTNILWSVQEVSSDDAGVASWEETQHAE